MSDPGQANWSTLVPLVVMMVVFVGLFWWILVRPAAIRQRRHQQLINSLEVGDKVVTVGGIFGTITRVGEKTIDVDVGEVTLTMDRRAIRRKQSEGDI